MVRLTICRFSLELPSEFQTGHGSLPAIASHTGEVDVGNPIVPSSEQRDAVIHRVTGADVLRAVKTRIFLSAQLGHHLILREMFSASTNGRSPLVSSDLGEAHGVFVTSTPQWVLCSTIPRLRFASKCDADFFPYVRPH